MKPSKKNISAENARLLDSLSTLCAEYPEFANALRQTVEVASNSHPGCKRVAETEDHLWEVGQSFLKQTLHCWAAERASEALQQARPLNPGAFIDQKKTSPGAGVSEKLQSPKPS